MLREFLIHANTAHGIHGQRRAHRNGGRGHRDPAQHHLPRRTGERARGYRPYFRPNAQTLHPDSYGGYGNRRTDPLRPVEGADRLPRALKDYSPRLRRENQASAVSFLLWTVSFRLPSTTSTRTSPPSAKRPNRSSSARGFLMCS